MSTKAIVRDVRTGQRLAVYTVPPTLRRGTHPDTWAARFATEAGAKAQGGSLPPGSADFRVTVTSLLDHAPGDDDDLSGSCWLSFAYRLDAETARAAA